MIKRDLEQAVRDRVGRGKAIIVLGARQVGKTTLLRSLLADTEGVMWLNADEPGVRDLFDRVSRASFAPYLGTANTVVIDEAQRISDIGVKLKLLHEAFGQKVQFIATGSSSFDLANQINEPMTGRKWGFHLYPVTLKEMVSHHGLLQEQSALDTRLTFGFYPEVVTNPDDAVAILTELANDNLYKDIFKLREIRRSTEFERLTKALAYQIGSEVNLTGLGQTVSVDKRTADQYIRLLEQAYIVFRVGSYSRNLRNELKRASKVYFYDTGLRNALIGDFTSPQARGDIGHLFENFVIAEMVKQRTTESGEPGWFWRTSAGQEVDFIRRHGPDLEAFEIKWSPKAKARLPRTFVETYKPAKITTVNRGNLFQTLLPQLFA